MSVVMLSPSGGEAATRSVMAKSLGLLPSPGLSIRTPGSHRPFAAVSGLTSSRKVRSIGDVALFRTTRRGPALDAPSTRSVEKLSRFYPVEISYATSPLCLLMTQGKSRSQGGGLYSKGTPRETWQAPDGFRQPRDGGLWDSIASVSQEGAV